WTWIDVEGSVCRDGSATGIGVRLQDGADDLVIYLEGGGACFTGVTCATNPSSFGETEFGGRMSQVGEAGLFSTTSASNPVADWNAVYVPYCTGDVHAGTFPNNNLLDATQNTSIGVQQFVGHLNVERALALLAEGLDTPGQVLLTGSSAGGLGTLINFDAVAQTFSSSDLALVSDSGPLFFADNVLSPPLMDQVIALYNVPPTIPGAPQLFATDALPGVYDYYATTYPGATFGLASYLGDDTFQAFYGFGQAPGDLITDEEYAAGLRDVRAQLGDAWGTYFAEGDGHTFLLTPDRYTGISAGVALDA
ncbi:MAG: pectin acetylesterase-family hydrolase, partial [Bacteroidota bacterium]